MSDVCLLLEGTYPYITGGVSSCVHQLIEETPHINYSIVYIGPKREQDANYKYKIPKNVKIIKELYLFETLHGENYKPKSLGLNKLHIETLKQSILFGQKNSIGKLYSTFFDPNTRICDPQELFFSQEVWNIIEEEYNKTFNSITAPSFIDFFYTWRFSNYPIFKILSMDLPKANVYHTMCTGYAGLLGCVATEKFKKPFILTEHGIYTHERKIEISQSQWLYSNKHDVMAKKQMSYFKNWWYQKFKILGELTYSYSDTITTLYNGNREKQIQLGADNRKIKIIPNGINPEKLKINPSEIIDETQTYNKPDDKIIIGLVGRIVPIKDIKTFIKSIAYVTQTFTDIEVLIMGPIDEDEEYFEECETLVKLLDLEDYIIFTGKINLKYYYQHLDIIVLSSISEGQPLVLLEAFAFKIPAIATDVGSCSELIDGASTEDKALGSCGKIIPFGMSDKLGQAILELAHNEEQRVKMGEIAYVRFMKFYQEKYTINNYLKLYNKHLTSRI